MTVANLLTYVRQGYNAVGDSFWSDSEIYNLMYQACIDLARECKIIEATPTITTVAGTRSYAYPTNVIDIKRITYNGRKLSPINFREDDAITGLNQSTLSSGEPQYYSIWNQTIYLRPIPDAIGTLQLYSNNEPAAITSASTLEIPTQFHLGLKYYCLGFMALKDKDLNTSQYYMSFWEKEKAEARKWVAKKKRTDGFGNVQPEEALVGSLLGVV